MPTITYEVTPRFLADRYTAVMRAEVPMSGLPAWLDYTFRAVREHLRRTGVTGWATLRAVHDAG